MTGSGDARIHLHLRDRRDDDLATAVRQQLAACLASGARDIAVHADDQPELDLDVLRTLQGAAQYLASCGGALTLVGAQPRVLDLLRIFELDAVRLAPARPEEVVEPYPGDAVARVAQPATSAGAAG